MRRWPCLRRTSLWGGVRTTYLHCPSLPRLQRLDSAGLKQALQTRYDSAASSPVPWHSCPEAHGSAQPWRSEAAYAQNAGKGPICSVSAALVNTIYGVPRPLPFPIAKADPSSKCRPTRFEPGTVGRHVYRTHGLMRQPGPALPGRPGRGGSHGARVSVQFSITYSRNRWRQIARALCRPAPGRQTACPIPGPWR